MNFADPSKISSLVIEPASSDDCGAYACKAACSCDSDNMCKCHDIESPKTVVKKHYTTV